MAWTRMVGLSVLVPVLACAPMGSSPEPGAGEAAAALHALFDEAWTFELQEFPLRATSVGVHDHDDRLSDMTIEAIERRAATWQIFLDRAERIDAETLDATDRVSRDMFRVQLRDRLKAFEFDAHLIPITAETGFHTSLAMLPSQVPLATEKDHERYLARLTASGRWMEQHVALMREGIARGMVLPRVVLDGYDTTIRPHIVDAATDSVFWAPFDTLPSSIPPARADLLRERARAAIGDTVVPAYRMFLRFMIDEYIPACRDSIGAKELPNGAAYYEHLVRHFTTQEVSAEEVHQIGLGEVERIRREMQGILDRLGFEGDLAAFLEFLRTDPRFFARTPDQLLREAAFIAKTMDGKLPALFGTLPRLTYTVEPVPDHLAPKYTAGRYVPAPEGSNRPGIYWVNTYALESRPLWALRALSLHEAVPGHHFQHAIARELEDLPPFRRHSYVNAFGEGWGLYSEWLGVEAGMYEDPYDDFGRLTYEMWRACRLVVDTGLHAFGWTRQQALDFLADNTALSRHEIATETDRYISWPGQALAYKMGELKLRELRVRASRTLEDRFDVREFHDVVLSQGTVPLTVLETQVERYIREAQRRES